MQLNVLNDLAEAMKALDGKKAVEYSPGLLHGQALAQLRLFQNPAQEGVQSKELVKSLWKRWQLSL